MQNLLSLLTDAVIPAPSDSSHTLCLCQGAQPVATQIYSASSTHHGWFIRCASNGSIHRVKSYLLKWGGWRCGTGSLTSLDALQNLVCMNIHFLFGDSNEHYLHSVLAYPTY